MTKITPRRALLAALEGGTEVEVAGADAVAELGIPNVFIATGAKWRRDGIGR